MAARKNNKNHNEKPELMIGGQAVIEGVLMRSKTHYAVAVRDPKGRIILKKEKFISATSKSRLLGLPFIRGIAMLVETMVLGVRALNYSANVSLDDGEEKSSGKKVEFKAPELAITLALSIIFAIALFKLLPLVGATFINKIIHGNNLVFNIIDGVIKILVLIIYLLLIGLMKDVKRLFAYHGAEHKAVSCYESGLKLTPKNARGEPKAHPRCGTSFILLVLFLSIIFYLLIPLNTSFIAKLGIRILFLPIIAGISYEWIKLASRHPKKIYSRILIAPGLLIQGLTTREPDDKQIEVAIKALKAVI
jgi:uncharacterized protein YqhQ